MQRVLVGTVGYHNLRNHSVGPILFPRLQSLDWPPGFMVEEMNWGPVAILQRLQAEPEPFQRIVFLTARPDEDAKQDRSPTRPEGRISLYRWAGGLPGQDEIQQRVAEAVTGVISLDNLLVVGEYFAIWPEEVFIVDVAPGRQEAGPELRAGVAGQVPMILQSVRDLALGRHPEAKRLPLLRGTRLAHA